MSGALARRYRRLIGMALAGGVAVVSAVYIAANYRHGVERSKQLQASEATRAAGEVTRELQEIARALQRLTRIAANQPELPAEDLRTGMHELLLDFPAVARLRWVDSGAVQRIHVARAELDWWREGGVPYSLQDCAHVGASEACFSEPFVVADTEPHVAVLRRSPDAPGGYAVAEVNMRGIWDVVHGLRIGARGQVYVVDWSGRLIAHPDLSRMLSGQSIAGTPLWQTAMTAATGSSRSITSDGPGGASLVTLVRLESPRWFVVAEQPLSDALAPVYAVALVSAAALLAGLAGSVLLANALARQMTRPVLALQQGVERFAAGDLHARVSASRDDELASLAQSFNRMAGELASYTGQLERRVEEKTRQLAEANEHKSRFLANVSHELRTPLNAVIGFSEALKEKLFGELNARQLDYVNDIHASGLHLLALINDLLDLSKIEAGRMELDVHPFAVPETVERVISLLRERALRGGVKLVTEMSDAPAEFRGDERRIRQVLTNLVSNAVKFTRSGGEVEVRVVQSEAGLMLSVRDTGIGIAPEDVDRLFLPFNRITPSDGEPVEGTGLGLALSQRLVELHGGTIAVESLVGRGSTFTVHLPQTQGSMNGHDPAD